jgi:type IV secretory pathway TrbD component
MDEPRRIPIHRSINRAHLMMGGERELVLMAGVIAGLLFVSQYSLISAGEALVFWVVCVAVLQRMAKVDPSLSKIYRRHIKYRMYYPGSTSIHYTPKQTVPVWKP